MTQKPETYRSLPIGKVPNSRFPVLVHRGGVADGGVDAVWQRFDQNGWLNNWQNPGVYDYGHFHSTSHECLGCAAGWMDVQLFGDGGITMRVNAGDVLVLPAGVSHAMRDGSDDLIMVGGYPDGRDWDNMRDVLITEDERRAAAKRIMMLPIPPKDPVTGQPIREWLTAPSSGAAGLDAFRDGLENA